MYYTNKNYNKKNTEYNRNSLNLLGMTANGLAVYDRANSHFSDHGFSKSLMLDALSKVTQTSQFEKHIVNLGRVVGSTSCVSVTPDDTVIMAVRKNRFGPTPMVIGRTPEPCSSVVIILKKVSDSDGEFFILITAFIGNGSEPEPWDKQLVPGSPEYKKAIYFWQTHALLYDEEMIDHII